MTVEEILTGEKDNIEYKVDIPPKSETYMRTVVAFANGKGGRLVFGIENDTWKVAGFGKEQVFRKMDAVTNAIYDSCEPKITPSVGIQDFDGKYIIIVDIPAGMQCPYYIKSQGILEGTYIRVAGTTRKAARYQIKELILSSENRSYDQEKTDRELSDEEIETFCERLYQHALELCTSEEGEKSLKRIGKNQLLSFKVIIKENDKYYAANSYQLLDGKLEDYPDAAIQCAVFKGTTRNYFITKKEYKDCIDAEIEQAYAFVLEHIDVGARIEGLARQDIYELPIRSIREMITNSVCHRSYLSPGKIQVAIFDDRIEVTTPGMLDKDISIEQMKTGMSKIRNRGIAEVFSYMNLIEAWGSGIPKIMDEAKEYGLREPELLDRGSDFRMNLFRKKPVFDQYGVVDPRLVAHVKETDETSLKTDETNLETNETNETDKSVTKAQLSREEECLLEAIRKKPEITQKQLHESTGISLATVKRSLPKLQQIGKLKRIGNRRSGKWEVKD
ncbi:MAG: putative DNA binding domain-containing protein [Clostridiales bacterium]|nr:putative DNA binding domain-containing protein [Clostridiales bacterium]